MPGSISSSVLVTRFWSVRVILALRLAFHVARIDGALIGF
jgi:hypothetical protein